MAGIIMVIMVITLAGCGGGNPKALAKQTYDLTMEAMGALFNPSKTAELEKKGTDLAKKVDKLSASDKKIYEEELERLMMASLGGLFGAAGSLFNSAGSLLETVDTEDVQSSLNAAQSALDALKALGN